MFLCSLEAPKKGPQARPSQGGVYRVGFWGTRAAEFLVPGSPFRDRGFLCFLAWGLPQGGDRLVPGDGHPGRMQWDPEVVLRIYGVSYSSVSRSHSDATLTRIKVRAQTLALPRVFGGYPELLIQTVSVTSPRGSKRPLSEGWLGPGASWLPLSSRTLNLSRACRLTIRVGVSFTMAESTLSPMPQRGGPGLLP